MTNQPVRNGIGRRFTLACKLPKHRVDHVMSGGRTRGCGCAFGMIVLFAIINISCVPDLQQSIPNCSPPTLVRYADFPADQRSAVLERAAETLSSLNGTWTADLDCSLLGDPIPREIQITLQGFDSENIQVVTSVSRNAAGVARANCPPVGSVVVVGAAALAGVEDDIDGRLVSCKTKPSYPASVGLLCDFGQARDSQVESVLLSLPGKLVDGAESFSITEGRLLFWFFEQKLSGNDYRRIFWNCGMSNIRKAEPQP